MSADHDAEGPFPDASNVAADGGAVFVDGPDGVAAAFTPEAAEETGRRLIDAAMQARGQSDGSGG